MKTFEIIVLIFFFIACFITLISINMIFDISKDTAILDSSIISCFTTWILYYDVKINNKK